MVSIQAMMAETEGFEPSIGLQTLYSLSRGAPSATRPRLHEGRDSNMCRADVKREYYTPLHHCQSDHNIGIKVAVANPFKPTAKDAKAPACGWT